MNDTSAREQRTSEYQLRAEIEDLKRQLEEQKKRTALAGEPETKGPSARTALIVFLLLVALAVAGYYYGYRPRQRREQVLGAESAASMESLPVVNVVRATR